jgi:hypothetical protein
MYFHLFAAAAAVVVVCNLNSKKMKFLPFSRNLKLLFTVD